MNLEPYQQRVVEERRDLEDKLSKLTTYLMTPAAKSLRIAERNLLIDQARIMREYSYILGERISLFTNRAKEAST